MSNNHFYTNLPLADIPVSHVVAEEHLFEPVPSDWHVIITDIKSSTKGVQEGKHQIINLVATGSIIAAINLAKAAKISIPFFFGGDGATLLIPSFLLDSVMKALIEHQQKTAKNFDLDLRVGQVPGGQGRSS